MREWVPVRRLDDVGLGAVAAAIADPPVLARYRAKVATVSGTECPVVDRGGGGSVRAERTDGGHDRFWYAPGRVIIPHRFAFAVMYGVVALRGARLLARRCHKAPTTTRGRPNSAPGSWGVSPANTWRSHG